jgi:hypothetical protein
VKGLSAKLRYGAGPRGAACAVPDTSSSDIERSATAADLIM